MINYILLWDQICINDRFTLLRDCCNLLLLKPLETLETVGIGGGGGGSDWSLL